MANIETLLNKNDETIYPVTKTEAVYNAAGTETLDNTLDKKANISTASADTNKMMKADGTKSLVTSSNIDFTTLVTTQPYTVRDGFEYSRGTIYKFGKSIFMNIILKATADASGNVACLTLDNVAVFGSTNTPFKAWEGTDEWTQNTAKGAYTYYNVITIQGGVVNGKYYLLSLPMIQTN